MISLDNIENLTTAVFSDEVIEIDSSTLQGLKKMPVDIFDNVYLGEVKPDAVILCIDIRGFSNFFCAHDEKTVFSLITSFTSNFLSCVNQFGYKCSYYKLLGDGALVIWDKTDSVTLKEAITVFETYNEFLKEELFAPYPELGLGGALVMEQVYKYEISAETSQLKYRDYVGYGINLVCRLQTLADKSELLLNKNLADLGVFTTEIKNCPERIEDIKRLKGVKKEDRENLYFFTGINPSNSFGI
ncbi:adenylate/guanylate cyclase domain-containing protein [Treponema pedis]|nr:adenylate/guanylate cyclase domain-containing protein [Treponema pedis]QOW62228.1 adenylate/guanylate cyclase domain-containing protein [Treponema pedis]QSI03428.1 hypothetical protein DYQ05_00090 [Treponema pedis]